MARYCIDCRHFMRGFAESPDRCMRPLGVRTDLVWGATLAMAKTPAATERRPRTWYGTRPRCGPDAIFFEPKSDDVILRPAPGSEYDNMTKRGDR